LQNIGKQGTSRISLLALRAAIDFYRKAGTLPKLAAPPIRVGSWRLMVTRERDIQQLHAALATAIDWQLLRQGDNKVDGQKAPMLVSLVSVSFCSIDPFDLPHSRFGRRRYS
jgi:hypothetical protein